MERRKLIQHTSVSMASVQRREAGPPEWLIHETAEKYRSVLVGVPKAHAYSARQHSNSRLLREIESIYDECYANECDKLERSPNLQLSSRSGRIVSPEPLDAFVRARCRARFGNVSEVYGKQLWELMLNCESARRENLHTSITLFCAFVSGSFTCTDMLLFLFARQHILVNLQSHMQRAYNHVQARSAEHVLPDALVAKRVCHDTIRHAFPSTADALMLPMALKEVVDSHLPSFPPAAADEAYSSSSLNERVFAYAFLKALLSACSAHSLPRDVHMPEEGGDFSATHDKHAEDDESQSTDGDSSTHSMQQVAAAEHQSLPQEMRSTDETTASAETATSTHAVYDEQYHEPVLEHLRDPLHRACRDYSTGVNVSDDGRTERTVFLHAWDELHRLLRRVNECQSEISLQHNSLEALLLDAQHRVQKQKYTLTAHEAYAICRRVVSSEPVRSVIRDYLVGILADTAS